MHIRFPTERISNVFDISPFNSSIRRPSDTKIIALNGMNRCFFFRLLLNESLLTTVNLLTRFISEKDTVMNV